MALKKTLTIGSLFAIFASGGFASLADAQQARMNTPSATFEHRAIEMPDNTGPMVTPGVFNYDAQMFAPLEFTNDKQLEPNRGFFFSADKVLFSLSLPGRDATGLPIAALPATTNFFGEPNSFIAEGNASRVSPSGNDWQWGERYNFGWAGEDDRGWSGSFLDIAGATPLRTRTADLTNNGLDDSGTDSVVNPDAIDDDINNFGNATHTLSTVYRVGELNRFFRQVLKNGDVFEPYIGGRYTQINDDSEDRFIDILIPADLNGDGTIDPPDEDTNIESRLTQAVTNSAIGFQLGGRHLRRRGRFTYITDGSLAISHNRQRLFLENFNVAARAGGGPAVNFESTVPVTASTDEYFASDSLVPSIDLEFAISYNVTRDITLRAGTNLNYLWQNVARADITEAENNPNYNPFDIFNEDNIYLIQPSSFNLSNFFDNGTQGIFEDSFIAAGFTVGVEWRR